MIRLLLIFVILSFSFLSPLQAQDSYTANDTTATSRATLESESQAFIERFYVNILGRASDENGMNFWLNQMQTKSATQVAFGFFNSPEFAALELNNEAFINILYQTMFDRPADSGGSKYWLERLKAGTLREFVLYGFFFSQEFDALAQSFGVSAVNDRDLYIYQLKEFVARFYQLLLNRMPERSGLNYWTEQVLSGKKTAADIATIFFFSNEFNNLNNDNRSFLEIAYRALLNREPEAAGITYWLKKLAEGVTRKQIVNRFLQSNEFKELAVKIDKFEVDGSANIAPVANANGAYSGTRGSSLNFSSEGSTDPDGEIISFAWDFGDGENSSLAKPGHTYNAVGTYTVTLAVTDNGGKTATDTTSVIITDITPVVIPDVSINSTSKNGRPLATPVVEQALAGMNDYQIFAINDLGMHCGDLDTRISSILPPFNVLHATVVRRGSKPDLLKPADGISVIYSAASNPHDPILSGINSAGSGPVASSMLADGNVYKTNFWDTVDEGAYDPFYPEKNPFTGDSLTPLGEFPFNVFNDVGLPMPDVELLHLHIPSGLEASQQLMPGILAPFNSNEPQNFSQFVKDQPFFIQPGFKFGYVSEGVNWFEAAGIPLTAYDDFGRENPWPLYRVQAIKDGNTLASIDTVVPISGEANCGFCHNDPEDGGNGAATEKLHDNNVPIALASDDKANVPDDVSKEWAADLNLIRLHDLKHATNLESSTPVVCQTCHYTPALDLAQLGPLGPENDPSKTLYNGRDQFRHKSMSNVMHRHHGMLDVNSRSPGDPGYDGKNRMFPSMPAAIKNELGIIDNYQQRRKALEKTCYQCHPGRRTDCLRGAMSNGGMLCQDCHGNMEQVGDDFTRNISSVNSGAFELGGDFYTNADQPRVPWANEPGCGSCHTGDALDNLSGTPGTVVNRVDTEGNKDNIRLFQAYLTGDPKATPIVPDNKRFAENVIEADNPAVTDSNDPRIGNPMLYRVSTGHEGVFCEACHGATHGIWPNRNPNANDNIASIQLQGHRGTITECNTCHTGDLGVNLGGPHGMHPVGSAGRKFAEGDHEHLAERNPAACRACHGRSGEGTVLSAMARDRVLKCDDKTAFCPNGNSVLFPENYQVGCTECHKNEL